MGDQSTTDALLHAYFDGELSPSEAAEVRARLEAEPRLRAKLDGLGEVRAVVRASVARGLDDLSSEDLWARIEARIASPESEGAAPKKNAPAQKEAPAKNTDAARLGLRVVPGGAAPESERASHPVRREQDEDAALQRRRVIGVVIAGLALAAAVLLLVLRPGEHAPGGATELLASGESGDDALAPFGPTPEPTAEELVFSTEVLEVDFGDNSGAVFSVEGDDGGRYAVVWLADVQPKRTAER